MKRLPIGLADFFPELGAPDGFARSPGLHLSDVVRSLCASMEPDRYPPKGEDDVSLVGHPKVEFGSTVEDALGDAFAHRHTRLYTPGAFHPGETERDGIIGTPDFLLPVDPEQYGGDPFVVAECKGTWLSSRHDILGPKFTYFRWQGRSYAVMLGLSTWRLYVFHVMGNYKFNDPLDGPGSPGSFRVYEETLDERQKIEHWRMITAHAERMRARGEA